MKNYDTIEEVEKGVDHIEEVEKFNPFHDARGRFASSNGFKSYSANPNSKAGAMAIARSAAAGHGTTANVHRESYGENIRQNANWIGRGQQGNSRWQGNATLRNRIEPGFGLSGAASTGAAWQKQNQQQGRKTQQPKQQPQQTQQKPAPQKQTKQPQQPQKPSQKPAQQPQQQPQKKPASDRQPVDGKDISKTFKYDPRANGSALDQVAEQQGFKGKPQVIKDSKEFSAAVKASGFMAYRTVNGGTDVVTGKHKSSQQFADDIKNSDKFSHNGTGGKVYGGGMYIAATPNPVKGKAPGRSETNAAKSDSKCYGGSTSTTMGMTLHPSAKVGDYSQMRSEFSRMPSTQRAKYGNDVGAYAASKGYDALRAVNAGWNCDYITVYNRSKLVVFDG